VAASAGRGGPALWLRATRRRAGGTHSRPPSRGAGWVAVQFAAMAAAIALGFVPPKWPDGARWPLAVAGAGLALAGAGTAAWSARLLGAGLTPFPRPRPGAPLVRSGPYRVVRHPLYAGGLLFFAGYGLAASVAALAAAGALGVVWGLKARVEERHLAALHPEYGDYAARVRFRLVPGVY